MFNAKRRVREQKEGEKNGDWNVPKFERKSESESRKSPIPRIGWILRLL
jgi:hypothetical protein